MTDPTLDLVTDHDVLAAYADLPGWDAVRAAGAVPPVSHAAVDQAVAAVAAESSVEGLDAAPVPHRRGRRRVLMAAGLVAAVAAAVVVLPSALRAPSASVEAASLLTKAADAIHPTDPVARPDQWWRISSAGSSLSVVTGTEDDPAGLTSSSWLVESTRTEYSSVDGQRPSVVVDSTTKVVRKLSGPSDAATPVFGEGETWTTGLAPTTVPGSWQQPSPAWLASLPLDPAALRDRLYADTAGHGRSVDGEAFVYVADLLRSGVVPADLRAALYRVLATVPGVEITSSHATIGGATGVGLGYYEAANGTRQEIVVSPADGELVGERYVAVEATDGIPAGTVTGTTTWTRALVDEVPAAVRAAVVDQNCTASADGGVSCVPAEK
jgi:RNA polymerase sigma-70 factor (ECF subfamily)